MNEEVKQNKIQIRTKELLNQHFEKIYKRTDRMFGVLFVLQWIFGILLSVWISPKTWAGIYSQTHIHVWTALFLGALIISLPLVSIWRYPGKIITRYLVAIGQTLFSALLIHLTGGRIETHFHVFGSLAFLAFYRDWKVLIMGSVIVALDHLIRGIYFPQSVYGIITIQPWRWFEHAGWVTFIDVFLLLSIFQSKKEMNEIAVRQASLEFINKQIDDTVNNRTKELKETQIQLLQANKLSAMGELAAGITHELTQPLFGIKGLASSLENDIAKNKNNSDGNILINQEQALEDLKIILAQTDRMSKLVSTVRNFSKNDLSDYDFSDLHKAIEDAFTLFNEQLKVKKIIININLISDLPKVYCNPNQIQQLFINLISNSSDAIGEKYELLKDTQDYLGQIALTSSISQDNKFVNLNFSDNGMGMNKETQEKLFEAFYSTKKNGKGTGLGMSIVAKIVSNHNGYISVSSIEGKGTSITIQLPLVATKTKESVMKG